MHTSSGKIAANGFIWRESSFIGFINTESDAFHLEHFDHSRPNIALMYKENDVKYRKYKHNDNMINLLGQHRSVRANGGFFSHHLEGIYRRPQLPLYNHYCSIHLVTDYRFLRKYRNDINLASNEMILEVNIANQIFERTDFNKDGIADKIGLRPVYINILNENDPFLSYLDAGDNGEFVLHSSARIHTTNCLQVFFLHRPLYAITTQLAVLGGISFQAKEGLRTGICTIPIKFPTSIHLNGRTLYGSFQANKILISTMFDERNRTRTEIALVLAHEIGHAFGSSHDDVTDWSQSNLMESISIKPHRIQDAYFTEHNINEIMIFLKRRAGCFQQSLAPFCGNGIQENGEQCDCGPPVYCSNIDICCYPASHEHQCKLKPNAQCNANDVCCNKVDCRFTHPHSHHQCNTECYEESFCDGTNSNCPVSAPKPNNTVCSRCLFPPCSCNVEGVCFPKFY